MCKIGKWNLIPIVGATLFLFIIITPSAAAREETVSLTFKKTAPSADEDRLYTVKAGESISDIIHDELGASYGEIYRILDKVKELNPQIKDINIIHAGQEILLPGEKKLRKKESPVTQTPEVKETAAKPIPIPIPIPKEESAFLKYTVKRGDSLSAIIHSELGVSYREMHTQLEEVKKLNPHIRDINIIRPGDVLTLPVKGKETPMVQEVTVEKEPVIAAKEPQEVEKPAIPYKPFLSMEKELEAIGHVVGRMAGSVITEGTFYIPLPPAGQMSINCAMVPIVEFDEGMTLLLDFSNRVPENLKNIIESTWKNYFLVRGEKSGEAPSMLEGVIDASRSYSLKRPGNYKTIGNTPKVNVYCDWIVTKMAAADESPYSFAINLIQDQASLLHANVKNYTSRNGLEIIEILRGTGIVTTGKASQTKKSIALNYETKLELAESLLSTLGYTSVRDSDIQVFDIEKDGFNLSIKTDLSLKIDGKQIVILSKKIPEQFSDTLEEKGTAAIILSDGVKKGEIIEKISHALNIPSLTDDFRFSFSGGKGEILLPAIRVKSREGFLYFIDHDIDGKIYGLLNEKWEVNTVTY
ncbi:MAG: LysM peptidoglycan-binding domain-containing protein [Syntrophaceae bacterium]|nr:LysM peptidoglycan-binding domain-containing protein [Syntrophaceae bacterium]